MIANELLLQLWYGRIASSIWRRRLRPATSIFFLLSDHRLGGLVAAQELTFIYPFKFRLASHACRSNKIHFVVGNMSNSLEGRVHQTSCNDYEVSPIQAGPKVIQSERVQEPSLLSSQEIIQVDECRSHGESQRSADSGFAGAIQAVQ